MPHEARSAILRRRLDLTVPALLRSCARLAEHPQFERMYAEYLFLLHSMVRAAVPLMLDAVGRLEAEPQDDVSVRVIVYLRHHISEERDHDEWILEDLEELGVHRDEVLRRVPSPTVAGLVGAQYYWIRHYDPIALLGYMAVLEGYPPSAKALDELAERTGVPRAAFRTLQEHAIADTEHSVDLYRLIDEAPFGEEQFRLLCINTSMTVVSLMRSVEELLDHEGAFEYLQPI